MIDRAHRHEQGKDVAVIGCGSSAIQIVPSIQPHVKRMDQYIRGKTWIAATFGNELVRERNDGQDGNFEYTVEEREQWRKDPTSYLKYRKLLEAGMQGTYAVTHRGTKEHDGARIAFDQDMRARLAAKPEIISHMLPDFPPLCRRLTPGPGYLEALTAPNVVVIPTTISHLTATGVVTSDGTHRAVDAIICATGFDTSYRSGIPIIGRHGQTLQARYHTRPETYLSMCTDGFPNFFQSLGPNAGVGNGNLIIIIESIARYVGQTLRKLVRENLSTVEPRSQCVKDFTRYCDAFFRRTVFSAECGSWYKSSPPGASVEERRKGRVTALWPGSSMAALTALRRPRWEDFEWGSADGNGMGWLGNGWTVAERRGDAQGLSFYLDGGRMLHLGLEEEGEGEGEAREKRVEEEDFGKVPSSILSV